MKNFDTIMQGMTIERLAEMGVKLVNINGRENYYMTSTGQLYALNDYEAAVRHEYNWLCYDPNPEEDKNTEQADVNDKVMISEENTTNIDTSKKVKD